MYWQQTILHPEIKLLRSLKHCISQTLYQLSWARCYIWLNLLPTSPSVTAVALQSHSQLHLIHIDCTQHFPEDPHPMYNAISFHSKMSLLQMSYHLMVGIHGNCSHSPKVLAFLLRYGTYLLLFKGPK
jgi:hypothetical protein